MRPKTFLFCTVVVALSLTGCESATTTSGSPSQEQSAEMVERAEKDAEPASDTTSEPLDERQQAVAELNELLAKTEGIKFGSDEFYAFSAKYIESENVFEHKYKQSFLPKEDADPELLNDIKKVGIESEKKFIKDNATLIRLMTPLKPTIRCIVYYPDDTECLRFSFPYNELYLN